jgi:putative iron-dependent peroxidase
MSSPQSGIFALGTTSHAYLEFDLRQGSNGSDLVREAASLREPRTTMSGVNLVVGFRPELWRATAPDVAPPDVVGFNADISGTDGYRMPATQHDAIVWLSGAAYDIVFDTSKGVITALDPVATVADETVSWPYRHDRDLTGFIDGSENPSLIDAPDIALFPEDSPGAGGSVLLLQRWVHDSTAWDALPDADQEAIMGRTKPESVELDDKSPHSHVGSTDQDRFGKIFRRNMPFGTVASHGTMFVGFSADQRRLAAMLESMAGRTDGVRDELTGYTRPVTGAYYVVPSTTSLRRYSSDPSAS